MFVRNAENIIININNSEIVKSPAGIEIGR